MAILVLGSPSFFANDLMVSRVDLTPIFWLAATLCEHGNVVVTSAEVCEGVDVGQPMVGDVAVEQPVISSVDSPWQAATTATATKMDTLPTRLAIGRKRFTPNVCMLDNRSGIFRLVSPTSQVYRPNWVLSNSGVEPLMLRKVACIGFGIQMSELEPCPFQIQTSLGGASDKSHFMTRERSSM
jgi:hypothetical protein